MFRNTTVLVLFATALALGLSGCDSESLQLSVAEVDFKDTESRIAFDLYNGNPKRDKIKVELSASDEWFSLSPTSATSAAPTGKDEEDRDITTVEVVLDRTLLAGDAVSGTIEIKGRGLKKKQLPVRAAPPYEAISLSTNTLNLGGEDNYLDIEVQNVNKAVDSLEVFASPDSPWIDINRTAVALQGTNATATLVVGAKRSHLSGGYHEGYVLFEAAGFKSNRLRVLVFQPYQAIVTSNQMLDFERNERPLLMEVWNGHKDFESLEITAVPSHSWIEVLPKKFTSAAPVTSIDPTIEQPVITFDKRQVVVSIQRRRLEQGNHEGYILFRADSPLVASRPVVVKVIQDEDGPDLTGELRIETPRELYSTPYLVDFAFGLTNLNGEGFVAEPAQLTAGAFENGENVTALVRPVLHRGAVRQLRAEMVLDYSIGMRMDPSALDAMEEAATTLFLPALPAEGLVGATYYYRDDIEPARLTPFTLDHAYVANEIAAIRETRIGTFSSGSRMLDALRQAALRFNRTNVNDEERFILLLAGSGDTSSIETADRVVSAARQRHVKIHVISFLGDLDSAAVMLDVATRTDGVYLPVGAADELPRLMALVVDRLEANYLLRWATLERRDIPITPGFSIAFNSFPAVYTAESYFRPPELTGNVLEGRLRLAVSTTGDNAAALLRAEYVPRNITRIRLRVQSALDFTATPVPAAAGGLVEHWGIERSDEEDGTVILDMRSPDGEPLAFSTFGGLMRFDFDGTPPRGTPLFALVEVDNTVEEYSAGPQFFTIIE